MTLALTQSDVRAHIKRYLTQVNDKDEMYWIDKALRAKEDSLDYAIARDQLIKHNVLAGDPAVKSNSDYWDQFKQ